MQYTGILGLSSHLATASGLLAATGWFDWLSIDSIGHLLTAGSYLALFGLLFACGLGLPLPEDIPLLISGFLSAQGKMHLAWAGVAAWCGIIGGDILLYNFGRRYGMGITKVRFIGKHVTPQRIAHAETLFTKYGIWVVAIGRLFAGVRGAVVIAAGAVRFSFIKFIIADGLAAIISGGAFLLLGHWVGKKLGTLEQLQAARDDLAPYQHWAVLIVVVLAIGVFMYFRLRRKKHITLSDVVLDKASHCVAKDPDEHPNP